LLQLLQGSASGDKPVASLPLMSEGMAPQSNEPEHPLAQSFARLVDRFWRGEPPELSVHATGFLLQQLKVEPGARLLCSPRAIVSYACALASRGCLIFEYPPRIGGRQFHGSLWCGTDIGADDEAVVRRRLAGVAALVLDEGRLLIDFGQEAGAASSSAGVRGLLAAVGWEASVSALAPSGNVFLSATRCRS
jgi:hypothetical protein